LRRRQRLQSINQTTNYLLWFIGEIIYCLHVCEGSGLGLTDSLNPSKATQTSEQETCFQQALMQALTITVQHHSFLTWFPVLCRVWARKSKWQQVRRCTADVCDM
jgi:hypothetical protein